MGEQLANCLWCRADLANLSVPGDLLGREHIFDEKHLKRLHPAAEFGSIHSIKVRMDVVEQLRFGANLCANLLEHFRHLLYIQFLVECVPFPATFGAASLVRGDEPAATVAAELNTNMAEPAGKRLLDCLTRLYCIVSTDVVVAGNRIAHFASEQLIDRHPGALALDVP